MRSLAELVAEIRARSRGAAVFVVALDGRSGTGKSSLAASLGTELAAAVVDCDDFYTGGSDADWAARPPAERAAEAIDWRRLRREVVEPLRAGRTAAWMPYDWDAGRGRAKRWRSSRRTWPPSSPRPERRERGAPVPGGPARVCNTQDLCETVGTCPTRSSRCSSRS